MGYHILPPQQLSHPQLQGACMNLFNRAEAVCVKSCHEGQIINNGSERLIQERVTIRYVPVSKAMGAYNDKYFDIWLYGTDRRCYCPDYPMKCCCGCTTYSSVCSRWKEWEVFQVSITRKLLLSMEYPLLLIEYLAVHCLRARRDHSHFMVK